MVNHKACQWCRCRAVPFRSTLFHFVREWNAVEQEWNTGVVQYTICSRLFTVFTLPVNVNTVNKLINSKVFKVLFNLVFNVD